MFLPEAPGEQRLWIIGNREFIFLFFLGFSLGLAVPNLNTWEG